MLQDAAAKRGSCSMPSQDRHRMNLRDSFTTSSADVRRDRTRISSDRRYSMRRLRTSRKSPFFEDQRRRLIRQGALARWPARRAPALRQLRLDSRDSRTCYDWVRRLDSVLLVPPPLQPLTSTCTARHSQPYRCGEGNSADQVVGYGHLAVRRSPGEGEPHTIALCGWVRNGSTLVSAVAAPRWLAGARADRGSFAGQLTI